MRQTLVASAILFAAACAKGSTGESPAGTANDGGGSVASPQARESGLTATSAASTSPAAPAAAASGATGLAAWKGGYKSVPGTIVLPKDVKWKVPEIAAGIGEGTIALTVDRATGRVQGKVDGVLGPATMDGVARDGKIAATVSREDPTDRGFTGTLSGDIDDAAARGTLNVALADVSAVRSATFELTLVR